MKMQKTSRDKKRIAAIIQCTHEDIYPNTSDPEDYCIGICQRSGIFDAIVLAVPDTRESLPFERLAALWNVNLVKGPVFDVARRLLIACDHCKADIIARLLLRRFYLDTALVSDMIRLLVSEDADYITLARDFNYELAADIFTRDALARAVELLKKDGNETAFYRFSPWRLMEKDTGRFKTLEHPGSEQYPAQKVRAIKEKLGKYFSENQITYGWQCPVSAYAFTAPFVKQGDEVLDIACGLGEGSRRLAEAGARVVGVDLDKEYIEKASEKFRAVGQLTFVRADALQYRRPRVFDVIVCLNTLEHLPDPKKFLEICRDNLKPDGKLFLEVPLLLPRPLGEPLLPYHSKEYTIVELEDLLKETGFMITMSKGRDRGVYTDIDSARESAMFQCSPKK